MIIPRPVKRSYFGVPSSPLTPPDDENDNGDNGPSSTTVLIPLAISLILIILGFGLAVFLFVGYKRKQRAWVVDYAARRERERREEREMEKESKREGPGMWEVEVMEVMEVMDEDQKAGELHRSFEYEREWTSTPVSVTYHRYPLTPLSNSPSLQSFSKSFSTTSSLSDPEPTNQTPDECPGPGRVEMTFLIAMPSPPTSPSRSRRSSPASSGSSLGLSSSSSKLDSIYGESIPAVELGTVFMPVRNHEIGQML